jgi:hypothetical protein
MVYLEVCLNLVIGVTNIQMEGKICSFSFKILCEKFCIISSDLFEKIGVGGVVNAPSVCTRTPFSNCVSVKKSLKLLVSINHCSRTVISFLFYHFYIILLLRCHYFSPLP